MIKVIRVTRTEFELEDGKVFPIDPPLHDEMTPDEFQEHYNFAVAVVQSRRDSGSDDPDPAVMGRCRED
jgi:hypothetical protein